MASKTDSLSGLEAPDRVHYATGVMLGAEDFQAEQDYHRGRLARALAHAAGYGTLAGLFVDHQGAQAATGDQPARDERLLVNPGLAIDRLGRLIEVPRPSCLRLAQWYAAQPASELAQAWHEAGGAWEESPAGVVLDLFIRFVACPRGKTPSFAGSAFDSFDSITAARLRDGFAIEPVLRKEAEPVQPSVPWDDVSPGDAESLRRALFAAWREGTENHRGEDAALEPLDEHVPGQDPSALLLARVLLPADAPVADQRPARRLDEPVKVRNELRNFVVPLAALTRWLDIPLTPPADSKFIEETTP